jgi:hypothetical protein
MSEKRLWPRGKRVAVLVSVLFETWAEGKAPSYFPRTSPLKPGTVDHGAIQWGQYAGNEGVWRIIRILDRCGVPATFFCSGRSAELYPDAVRQAVKSGHDVAAHGYTQDVVFSYLSPDEQRATIRKVLDILQGVTGRRPDGWASAVYGWDQNTFDLLVQEGVRWYADALDISLPRRQKTASGSIMALPWSDFVDNRVLRASPRDFVEVYQDTFEYLRAHEPMSLLNIAFHSHFGGRPLMSAMLLKVLQFLSQFPDVWFVRHGELVNWLTEQKIDELPYAKRFFADVNK